MKKTISLVLVITICLSTFMGVYGEEEHSNLLQEAKNLGLNLSSIDSIPEGITPIIINSYEDLINFYNSIHNNIEYITDISNSNNISILSTVGDGGGTVSCYIVVDGLGQLYSYDRMVQYKWSLDDGVHDIEDILL